MGNQGVLARFVLSIICRVHAGREYWRGRVLPSMGGGKGGGELGKAWGKSGHCGQSPKAARFSLALDHNGARIQAHPLGAFGPDFFALAAGEQSMVENQGTAASRGHVRAVWSQRCKGFAVSVGLLRAHLLTLRKLAALEAREVERRRLAAWAAGYLVSDYACLDDQDEGGPFVSARARHQYGFDRLTTTGAELPRGLRGVDWWGSAGQIDATGWMAGGSCTRESWECGVGVPQALRLRPGWTSVAAPLWGGQ